MKKLLSKTFFAAIGLALPSTVALADKTELTVSSWLPMTHHINAGILQPYAERVSEATDGRVKLNFLSKALGAPAEHFELARKGMADITWGNFTYEPKRFAAFTLFELPLLSSSSEVSSVAAWNTFDKYMRGKLKSVDGVEILGMMQLDPGQINMRDKAVLTAEDLKGKKVRAGGPVQSALLDAAGAVSISAPQSKSYELLSTGVVDGTFSNTESLGGFKLFEVLKYQTEVKGGAYNGSFFIAMNKKRFDKLPDKDKEVIIKLSGLELSRAAGQDWDHSSSVGKKEAADNGINFVEPTPRLLALIEKVKQEQQAVWMESAKAAGIENPQEVMDFFFAEIERLEKEKR